MHHSDQPPAELSDFVKKRLGATGEFPGGKLDSTDQGELAFAVTAIPDKGKIQIVFGKKVSWIGFNKEQALDLAELLKTKAAEL